MSYDFFLGIFAPDFLASLKAIATACFRSLTGPPLPPGPDFKEPSLYSFITLWTLAAPLDAAFFLAMFYPCIDPANGKLFPYLGHRHARKQAGACKKKNMTREDYGQAYQRGFNLTVRFLLSRGIHKESALEFAQSAWVRGWEKLAQLRDERMLATWVNSIALNHYRMWLRQQSGRQGLTDLPGGRGPNTAVIDMQRLLGCIPLNERLLLERRMHGESIQDLAKDNNVSRTAIRLRLMRARRAAKSHAENVHVRRGTEAPGRRERLAA